MTAAALESYIKRNVFCRCGQAVSRLAEAELIPRPEMPSSEREVLEWWLVTPELSAKLRTAGLPVLGFGELHIWGRAETAGALTDDLDLIGAIGPLPSARARRSRA